MGDGQMKHLCCWAEKSCWLSWGVSGNFLSSTELKSMSEAAGGTCPLGQLKAFSERAEQSSLFILENGAGRGGEGHWFLWKNLGVRCLSQISWGPWAQFLPWHVEVHVQIYCLSGESSRARAAPGWRSCRASTSRLQQCRWAGGWRERGETLAQPRA